ncbi:putative leucine-rich repeat-containing protein DDB_G0290503 [Drosophila bipectinata]|uniref:putative leucine-rich repeat-containing protein DDB_G0290503 n=1 Tax=Drosophila bipectinata TaxID=42026 RepID=UPI0038B2C447
MEVPRKATKRSGSPLPSWDQSKKRIENVQREIVIPRQQEDATQIKHRPDVLCLPDKISVSIKRLLKSFVTVHNASVADIKRFGRKVAHNAQKETIVSLHKDVQINELTKQMNSMYVESEEYKDNLAKLQKDYEELETTFSKANQQLLETENHFLNKLKKSKSLYDQLNADLSNQNASHEREMNNMKETNRKLSISIKNDKKNYEAKLAENREKIKQLKTLNNNISEELKSSALEMEKVMLQKQDLESEIREMKSQLDANNKTCAELNISLERLGNEHNDALEKLHVELNNHKLHYVELEMMIDERNKQLEQVNNEINCLKTEAVEKDTAQISLQVYINELEVQREELIKSNDKLAEQLEKLRLKAAEEIKTMKETNEEIIWELRSDIDKHIKAAAEALEDKEKVEKEGLLQISQIQSKLDNLDSECHELRDLKKSLENEMELKTRTWQDQEALQQQQIAELHDQYKLKVTELEGEIQREHELNESLQGVVKEKDIIINDTRKKLRDFVTANKALTNDMKIMKGEMKTIVENVSAAEKRFSDEIKLKQQDLEDFKKSLENEIELRNKNWEEQEMFLQKEFSELNDQYQNKVTEYEREAQLNISLNEVLGEKDKLINENHHKLQDLISEKEALTKDIEIINDDKQKVIDSFSAAEKRFARELETQEKNYKKKIEDLEKAFAQKSADWEKKEQDKDAVIAELTFKINRIGSVCDQSVGKASILKPVHIIKSTPQQKPTPKLQVVKNEAIVRPSTSKRQPIRRKVVIEQHLSDFESDNEESSSQKNRNNVTFKRPRVAANVVANVNVVEEDLFDSLKRSN